LVSLAWVFFRAENFGQAWSFLEGILIFRNQDIFLPNVFASIIGISLIGKVGLLLLFLLLDKPISQIIMYQRPVSKPSRFMLVSLLVMSLIVFGFWGEVDFIYFQF
jgi:hypothetical protein